MTAGATGTVPTAQRWCTLISVAILISEQPGTERNAGVLAHFRELVHLNLRGNGIGQAGEGRLRASWRGQT
jgi:hypothetical protein